MSAVVGVGGLAFERLRHPYTPHLVIRVLQDWNEIGRSYRSLERVGLPRHATVEKCWDLDLLRSSLDGLSTRAPVLDMGCGGLSTLRFLSALGFTHLWGIDLRLPLRQRLSPWRQAARRRPLRRPYRLRSGDLLASGFPDRSFEVVTCISTIEHGIDLVRFAAETSRLLAPGGRLFLTTDYWEPALEIPDQVRPFGLPWRVYAKVDVEAMVNALGQAGFVLKGTAEVPTCKEACVHWNGFDYTFVCLDLARG